MSYKKVIFREAARDPIHKYTKMLFNTVSVAIEKAVSVAGLLLLTEAVVTDIEEKDNSQKTAQDFELE
jgi:hypothetical protein